ncbi:hypothetical protein [Nocardioides lijunqiniae]|uniref:hypothetical protein n=1 Tax=Nocardioides lijunqiniae TaxID=2760832 RepID=UPI00187856B2|nr:hypothetical protein [Nocardioides lijunqiniae]
MSTIEDRLTRALEARADLVRAEDLRPLEVPGATVHRLRRPATYAVAAAACAAAIAAPFVLGGDGGSSPQPPVSSESPRPSLPPQQDVGGGWPIPFASDPVDVDGDGVGDEVRIRHEPGEPLVGARARVEVDLSATGATVFGLVETFGGFVNVADVVDLDGDGDRELTIYRGDSDPADGTEPFAVLMLVEGRLVEATQPESPPLVTGTVPADGGRARDSRVFVRDGALFSYLTVDAVAGGEPLALPLTYPVEVTRWSLEDGALVAGEPTRECVDHASTDPMTYDGLPVACLDGDGTAVPQLFPAAEATVGVGDSEEYELDGESVTVTLERSRVVLTGAGPERSVPLPEGGAPVLFLDRLLLPNDELALLVRQESGELDRLTVVTTWNGGLYAAEVPDGVLFGNGATDAGTYDTWIGPDRTLHTRLLADPDTQQYDVTSWTLGGTVAEDVAPPLQPLSQGCVRIDETVSPPTTERC